MRSYFVRHTQKLTIRDADLKNLWDEDRVAIHYLGIVARVSGA